MLKKRAYCITAMLLVFSMLCSMMLTVAAQSENITVETEPWQPPKNFVDPVTLKIQELNEQGLGT